ncbi:MAG: TauD/TfdA family dioxygenase, partial [Caulobacteraceae bacterium]
SDAAAARDFWAEVNDRIGDIDMRGEDIATLKRYDTIWNDIEYDPAKSHTYRHSNTAQPLHTDGAYNVQPASVCFFICTAQAASGGVTYFLDARDLVENLQKDDPALLHRLQTEPVRYRKGDAPGQEVTIIGQDAEGPLVNWNFYRAEPTQDPSRLQLCRDFFDYLKRRYDHLEDVRALRLQKGDCMAFHDLRVLHGRTAFEAKVKGDRCLWNLNLHWQGRAA